MNNAYEDYLRDVIGYEPVNSRNNFFINENNMYEENFESEMINQTSLELEEYYPDTYRLIYPMIQKICSQYSMTKITKETVDKMVEEIYVNFETEEVEVQNRGSVQAGSKDAVKEQPRSVGVASRTTIKEEERETRHFRPNNALKDLIKILILRELIDCKGCSHHGNRPHHRYPFEQRQFNAQQFEPEQFGNIPYRPAFGQTQFRNNMNPNYL